MGSLSHLVEPECAQPNALVKYTSQWNNDPKLASSILPQASSSNHHALVDEYMHAMQQQTRAPTTFSMNNLMHEITGINRTQQRTANQWADQFQQESQGAVANRAQDWINEFQPMKPIDEAWQQSTSHNSSLTSNMWSSEYLSNAESALSLTSQNDLQTSWDQAQAEIRQENTNVSENQEAFWDNMDQQWDQANVDQDWMSEFNQYSMANQQQKDYSFDSSNPYSGQSDVLEQGKLFFNEGNLAQAILCFEAAVEKEPQSYEAWHLLGMTQAENEQETQAICALKKCLDLNEAHLPARFQLAVAYTNENMYNDACSQLIHWLQHNPKYSQYVPTSLMARVNQNVFQSSFIDRDFFNQTEQSFLGAAGQQNMVDSDLQNALGVLYNISGNYDRAIDSFRTALATNPKDARMWNRLGATLANSSKSAEAVGAYSNALQLYPAFVRARYNLGISCLNLSSHKEALDHFSAALSLQKDGLGPTSKVSNMSDSIWNVMRVSAIGNNTLIEAIDKRDLNAVNNLIRSNNESAANQAQASMT